MNKTSLIKRKMLEARKSGDTEQEIRLIRMLAKMRGTMNPRSVSTEEAYGMMVDGL